MKLLLLLGLSCLFSLALAQDLSAAVVLDSSLDSSLSQARPSSGQTCPLAAGGQCAGWETNYWDWAGGFGSTYDAACYGKCCRATGRCHSSACDDTFGLPDARANCAVNSNDCPFLCQPYVAGCEGSGSVHCFGHVVCDPAKGALCNPSDPKLNNVCLYDGNSDNFKICGGSTHIVGDPQFKGLRGQEFQVHGVAGQVYSIISDKTLQYNSRFVFLDQGECPIVKGKKAKGCFSHPGSYLGELGLKTRAGDRIYIQAGPAKEGFMAVKINDQTLAPGESALLQEDQGYVSFNHTHMAEVRVGHWFLTFDNSDRFVNQRVAVSLPLSQLRSHGLLGQTWRDKNWKGPVKQIEGHVDDYASRSGDIFADDFVFNHFD